MTGELKLALTLSVGLHTGLLAGLPFSSPVRFDVERAPTSLEIHLVAPPKTAIAFRQTVTPPTDIPPEPSPLAPRPPDPVPQTVMTAEERGALAEILPGYLRNPPPAYPETARQQGWQGTVVLAVHVLPTGRCDEVRLAASSGYAILDDAARQAIARWQFRPARRLGKTVAVWVEIPVTFRLVDVTGG
ncbi:MAG: energy transducer TonB [Candidatus Omnitrophica bacterium]|nr:energy transducer TonB [Candidatus Omnitrophota bacterium]